MSLPYNCITETDLRAVASPSADLIATKTITDTDGGDLSAGDPLRFEITIENTGSVPATNVAVTDNVDANVGNLSAPTGIVNGDRITWDQTPDPCLASIAPGDSVFLQFAGTVSCTVADGTPICKKDGAKSDTMNEAGEITKTSPDCLTVAIPVFSASTKEIDPASVPARAGSTIHYMIHACNEGSGTATNVVVTDTLDASVDETTINAPGAVVAGNTITWTIPVLGPGAPGTPICQDIEFWMDVRAGVPEGTEICNVAVVSSDEWTSCGMSFATNRPCFITEAMNELFRECCLAAGPGCDLTAIWNPDLAPYPLSLPRAPGSVDDPETGVLTNILKQLVFYGVTAPSSANSVRCTKQIAGQTVMVAY
jgi:uncharacterized repeat protein (TIGR01451 family)